MSHFAEIDDNNIVLRVLVGNNNEPDEGYSWFVNTLGGRWVQTSYNNNFRVRFAGKGFTYDEARDAFIPPKPFGSWQFDETTLDWVAPVAMPDDGKYYEWNETVRGWVEIV